MALTEAQQDRALRMARGEWASGDELGEFFKTITDAEELHLYAGNFSWDVGCDDLYHVIRHPLCDRGTALLIYWKGGPRSFARYHDRSETLNPDAAATFDLLREIEKLVITRAFKNQRIPFDPKNDKGYDWTKRHSSTKTVRDIPIEMFG